MQNQNFYLDFRQWLQSKIGKRYTLISLIFSVIYSSALFAKRFVPNIADYFSWSDQTPDWYVINFFIQFVFIFFVVVYTANKYVAFDKPEIVTENERKIWNQLQLHRPGTAAPQNDDESAQAWIHYKKGANKVSRQFAGFWFLCWIAWLLLYGLLTGMAFSKTGSTYIQASFINLANNVSSLMLIFLFMTLTVSTSKYGFFYWLRFFIVIILFFILEYVMSKKIETTGFWFTLTSGVFASVAMSAFFGSINSRIIGIPLSVIPLLNIYAAIQPLYVFFEKEVICGNVITESVQIIVILFAFVLKAYLFLVTTWILQTGRLIHLIVQDSSLNFRTNELFKTFLENSRLREARLIEQEGAD